jgi:hypothetical protein
VWTCGKGIFGNDLTKEMVSNKVDRVRTNSGELTTSG